MTTAEAKKSHIYSRVNPYVRLTKGQAEENQGSKREKTENPFFTLSVLLLHLER